MKHYYKNELARAAGVSYSTFARFLKTRRSELSMMGISLKTQLLPPRAVEYLCKEFGITEADLSAVG